MLSRKHLVVTRSYPIDHYSGYQKQHQCFAMYLPRSDLLRALVPVLSKPTGEVLTFVASLFSPYELFP